MRSILAATFLAAFAIGAEAPALAASNHGVACDCPGGHGGRIVYVGHPKQTVKQTVKRIATRLAAPAMHRTSCPMRADRVLPRYAGIYYHYRSARRVDESAYTYQWQVAPTGYVQPPPMPIGPPPYDERSDAGYGSDDRNRQIGDNFPGDVSYPAEEVEEGGGVVTIAQPDSLNGPNYNSFGKSYGGDYEAAERLKAWEVHNHVRSTGY